MKLLFLYGPPATGKLTVGIELAQLLHYKILDNHKTVEMVRQLFPFENPELNLIRRKLQARFRLEMFAEAAKADVSFVTTCAVAGPQHFGFYRETIRLVEASGGQVFFVQLVPTLAVMFDRVESASRKNIKVETRQNLRRLIEREPEIFDTFPDVAHLRLDNSTLSPAEAARQIKRYYKL